MNLCPHFLVQQLCQFYRSTTTVLRSTFQDETKDQTNTFNIANLVWLRGKKGRRKKQLNYQLFEQKTKLNHFLGLLGWVERLLSWIDPPKVHVLVYLHTWLERVRRKKKKLERRISVLSTGSKYLNTFILLFRRIHYQLTRAFDHHRVV